VGSLYKGIFFVIRDVRPQLIAEQKDEILHRGFISPRD
jgi:hypothetical protein